MSLVGGIYISLSFPGIARPHYQPLSDDLQNCLHCTILVASVKDGEVAS